MKRILNFFFLLLFLISCSGSDDGYRNNPNIPDLNFRAQLNLSFPEYNDLQFAGNHFVTYDYGVRGIVIYNINGNTYTAFELTDPNHPPSNCSTMTVNGIIASCNCDSNEYNIVTGELSAGEGIYSMKPYRIRRSGNILEVWN